MKKLLCLLLSFLLMIGLLPIAGCASNYAFEEVSLRYFKEAEYDEHVFHPEVIVHHFDRKAEVASLAFYYESSLGGRRVDRAIERVLRVSTLCPIETPVYLSESALSHAGKGGFWVNVKDEEPMLLALLLAEKGEEKLPFGCYAGAGAFLLDEEYHGNAEKYPLAKELQYPLFWRDHKPAGERKAAWALAREIAEDYLSGHSLEEFLASNEEDFAQLFEAHCACVPTEYRFPVGDSAYPLQISTKRFSYRFTYDYRDRYYDKEFDLSYPVLKAFALENESFVDEAVAFLGGGEFEEPTNVYFGNDLIGSFLGGYTDPSDNYIVCNSVTVFSHEATHMISHYNRKYGGHELEEAFSNYLPYRSRFASWDWRSLWDLYSVKSVKDNLWGTKTITPKNKLLVKAYRDIYNANFGKADKESFDAMKYELCVAAHMENRREQLLEGDVYSALRVSLIHYVQETYGQEGLLQLIGRWEYGEIDGKTFEEILNEWEAYLDGFRQPDIYEAYLKKFEKKFGNS